MITLLHFSHASDRENLHVPWQSLQNSILTTAKIPLANIFIHAKNKHSKKFSLSQQQEFVSFFFKKTFTGSLNTVDSYTHCDNFIVILWKFHRKSLHYIFNRLKWQTQSSVAVEKKFDDGISVEMRENSTRTCVFFVTIFPHFPYPSSSSSSWVSVLTSKSF